MKKNNIGKLIFCDESMLLNRLRNTLTEWKELSSEFSNNRCCITGETYKDVHHLQSFNQIVRTFTKLKGINFYNPFEIYEDDMKLIEMEFVDFHKFHGLGVCLCDKIHKLFHLENVSPRYLPSL
jgi:hypothetical protein